MTVSAGSLQALPAPVLLQGMRVDRVESKDERRYAIFAEVRPVVAPDQNEVRVERVQAARTARNPSITIAERGAARPAWCFCPLLSHLRGPVCRVSGSRWQPWAVQHTLEIPAIRSSLLTK